MNNTTPSPLLERCDLDDERHFQNALAAHPLLERTAFHEAGHAVARMLMGRKVQRVWIDEAGNGKCVFVPSGLRPYDQLDKDPNVLYDFVKVGLAGPVAESLLLFGEDEHMLMQCQYEGEDIREARRAVAEIETTKELKRRRRLYPDEPAQVSGGELTEWIELSLGLEWNKTIEMLTTPTHWRAVKKIAQKLLQQRELSGRTVHRIFTQVTKQKMLSRSYC